MQPPIKWTGSKRSQAIEIISYFPNKISTYFEPFCGGGSIMLKLLESNIHINNFVISDINIHLISLWNLIKNNPEDIITNYTKRWEILRNSNDRNHVYLDIRNNFNITKDIHDFLFLNRTCFNGLIRFNKIGGFNSPFHFGRNGINPKSLEKIIINTSKLLISRSVQFKNCDYNYIMPTSQDFCYFDPPYSNTKGMYYGGIDRNLFFKYLENLKCSYIFSYDGIRNNDNFIVDVPKFLYDNHILTKSNNSGFDKLNNFAKISNVKESLYIKYK